MTLSRSSGTRLPTPFLRTAVALSTSLLLGCSEANPTQPIAHGPPIVGAGGRIATEAAGFGSASFYPLALGNSWDYAGGGVVRVLDNGSSEPYFTWAFTESDRLVDTAIRGGATYFVREEVTHEVPESPYGPFTRWTRLRQDGSGFYFADTVVFDPAASGQAVTTNSSGLRARFTSAGSSGRSGIALARLAERLEFLRDAVRGPARASTTPGAIDLVELSYPLRVGATWEIRPDINWPATVEKIEILDTPAGSMNAYRIGINPGGTMIGDGEWARVWYSREGYLGYSVHTFIVETDENGDPTGRTYVADDSMRVTSITISR
jgi:hypothetical protein